MRRKVRDVEESLPPGCERPVINDDFGDVYGLVMAITGDGFTYSEMEEAAKDLKKELSLVEGVARVEPWGVQPKGIYLEASETQLSQLGSADKSFISTLKQQNTMENIQALILLASILLCLRRNMLIGMKIMPIKKAEGVIADIERALF